MDCVKYSNAIQKWLEWRVGVERYAGYRFPAEVISYAVYLYFRFPLSLRMVEEMLAVRGIEVSHETVRKWGLKLGVFD